MRRCSVPPLLVTLRLAGLGFGRLTLRAGVLVRLVLGQQQPPGGAVMRHRLLRHSHLPLRPRVVDDDVAHVAATTAYVMPVSVPPQVSVTGPVPYTVDGSGTTHGVLPVAT